MTSTPYSATEEMTNINRVSRLLMGPCTDQFRDLLRYYVPPASFPAVLRRERARLPRLTEPQRNLILPNSGGYNGNYDDMDISLLYILLRNLCGIKAHKQGWGNNPDITDRSVSANIDRLRVARNLCGHSIGGMSNTDFNQSWSEIRAAVVDLDFALRNNRKYQEKVDFVRNDTMDPVRDKHHSDQLLEQMKEMEHILKEVNSLKSNQEEQQNRIVVMENRNIPSNIKEQHLKLLQSWQKEDTPFHEIHNFQGILDKVRSQSITTIIGGPGSGKTATARHLAFRWQTDNDFEVVPVDDILEVKQYGHPNCKQIFILDDVIGVFGFERQKLANLDKYSESILKVLGKHSKILFTCRIAVYNEAKILFTFEKDEYDKIKDLKSFALATEFVVDLKDDQNQLNDDDRSKILTNHCCQNEIWLSPNEKTIFCSTVGMMMYPLLCKLFCSESKYRASGKGFFEKPYACILDQMDHLKGYKPIHYASLVLCMFCQNVITESMLTGIYPEFIKIRDNVFKKCRVNDYGGHNETIKDSLESMINTFTTRTNEGFSLIHDSVYEVLAFHYGNKHQEDMLQYMSSSFIAKKFIMNECFDNPGDLHIKIHQEHYQSLAKRLVRDLYCMDLHDVFMNKTLKVPSICCAFIAELKDLPYLELKKLFFEPKHNVKMFISCNQERQMQENINTQMLEYEWNREIFLFGYGSVMYCTRVINWVIAYGHSQLLQFLFNIVTENQESIKIVMKYADGYISGLDEQARLLTLSSYSGDLEIVQLLLKYCDSECIAKPRACFKSFTPLTAACALGHKMVVNEFIKHKASIEEFDGRGFTALFVAVKSRNFPITESLLQAGANSNGNCEQEPPLFVASWTGQYDVVELLINYKTDCNKTDKLGRTPLQAASKAGHDTVVNLLINSGADCNKCDKDGRSPLHEASCNGHSAVVDLLIESGADCNKTDKLGRTPLQAASKAGHDTVVNLLIKSGADCNKCDKDGTSPLHVASSAGHGAVVDLLIKNGADSNKADKDDKTPLQEASCNGHSAVVDSLIISGADCNKCDKYGRSSLHEASSAGHGAVVDLLIKNGADCNKADKNDKTPLQEASSNGHSAVVDSLIKSGADCNKCDKDGSSPLHSASKNGYGEVVDLLIKGGADCNKADNDDKYPLQEASEAGHGDVVNFLIKGGSNYNITDKDSGTLLHRASEAGHGDVVKFLIEGGVDCNKIDINGRTPLHKACDVRIIQGSHLRVVNLLIKGGADCNKKDQDGRTPLHAASETGHGDIIDLLIKAGAHCNECDKNGRSPLHLVSEGGYIKYDQRDFSIYKYRYECALRLLIECGADINQCDFYGERPLSIAMKYNKYNIANILLEYAYGAKSNLTD